MDTFVLTSVIIYALLLISYMTCKALGRRTAFRGVNKVLLVLVYLALTVYGGAYSFSAEQWYVGATAGYTVSSITFQLGVEYANGKSYKYDGTLDDDTGLWIVPSIKIAF